MYKARIRVTLRKSILDPQGKAVEHALHNLNYGSVAQVRVGKYVELSIDEPDEASADKVAREACERLIANPVMEDFEIELEKQSESEVAQS
ncbi:MAG: phosphoribosylformylglycinamidine synthase subunit PurS [Bacteroidetes bacterium]|nr:phosphoribosylformylglycinamidine synthase subunit PurS [Bacteroidota bacterium]